MVLNEDINAFRRRVLRQKLKFALIRSVVFTFISFLPGFLILSSNAVWEVLRCRLIHTGCQPLSQSKTYAVLYQLLLFRAFSQVSFHLGRKLHMFRKKKLKKVSRCQDRFRFKIWHASVQKHVKLRHNLLQLVSCYVRESDIFFQGFFYRIHCTTIYKYLA